MNHTRPVRFFHRGVIVEHDAALPTRTVLEWLREDAHCTGTKEGCAEGDCGACTVVLGELDEAGSLALKPINACIRFLPTLDGKALFSVEDLAAADGTLHPVQQAVVEGQGFQCAFCMPGFVMATVGFLKTNPSPTRAELAHGISGNICRCADYNKILDVMMVAADKSRGA